MAEIAEELSLDEAVASYEEALSDDPEGQTEEGELEDDELDETEDELSDEDDEDEVETEDDGQAEDDDDEEELAAFAEDESKVQFEDGSVMSVSELKEELKNGTLRQADYTKGKMELSDQRRALESQTQRIAQQEQQLKEQQETALAILEGIMPQLPDPSLVNTDPVQYMQDKALYDQQMGQFQKLQSERQARQAELEQMNQGKQQEYIRKEWDSLLSAAPELKDTGRYQSFMTDMVRVGQEYGYTADELNNAVDHRVYLVMKDVIKLKKLEAKRSTTTEKVKGRPPVQRAGKRVSAKSQKARSNKSAMDRLKKSGSIEAATAAYLQSQQG